MKKVAGKLRINLAQYRELAAFAQFASDLDQQTQRQLERGTRITEILKQGWEDPVPVEEQIIVIWAATNGYTDPIKKEAIKQWETGFLQYVHTTYPRVLEELKKTKELSQDLENELKKACLTFNDINTQMQVESEE